MSEQSEQMTYDSESMCLPNSLEFAARTLLGQKADEVEFGKYRDTRAKQLEDESSYNSPLNMAKRDFQHGKVVELIARNRDEFVRNFLVEVSQQTGVRLLRSTQYVSEEDTKKLEQLVNRPNTVSLLSIRGHIEPITKDSLSHGGLKDKIADSFELAPFGNITVITKV